MTEQKQWVTQTVPSRQCRRLLRLQLRNANNKSQTNSNTQTSPTRSNVGTKFLWDDDHVNIWQFRIPPGEACHYHTHQLEYCFTNLTKSTTQALDDKGRVTEDPKLQRQGQTTYVTMESLSSHAVKNVGDTTFLQFIVEFKWKAKSYQRLTKVYARFLRNQQSAVQAGTEDGL